MIEHVDPLKIKEMFERTHLPILMCRRLLVETNGDVELAMKKAREELHEEIKKNNVDMF